MADSERHYAEALDIVNRYYQRIIEQMAYDIVEREESILEGGYGWTEVEDRFANRLFNISQIYGNLSKFATSEGDDEEHLAMAPLGSVEAARLQIDERRCASDQTGETIARWLADHDSVSLWKLIVTPLADDRSNCLFVYTTN